MLVDIKTEQARQSQETVSIRDRLERIDHHLLRIDERDSGQREKIATNEKQLEAASEEIKKHTEMIAQNSDSIKGQERRAGAISAGTGGAFATAVALISRLFN